MAVTAVIGIVVSIASLVAGTIQKSNAAKQQASQFASQEEQNLYNSQQANETDLIVGQGHDTASIYSAAIKGQLCHDAQVTVATRQQEGNVLIIIGISTAILTLGILVLKRKPSA